jgi:hypothetical protein
VGRYEDLDDLLTLVSNRLQAVKEALNPPRQVMAGGEAWTGTRADTFGDDIDYRRTDLIDAAQQLYDDIEAERNTEEPETSGDGN